MKGEERELSVGLRGMNCDPEETQFKITILVN